MKRTVEQEIEYYGAEQIGENIYVGVKNIVTGFRVITKEKAGYTSIIVQHSVIDAIDKFRLNAM
ncbi:hypothetical protein NST33_18410 [Paenibacillus sp. FSL L8-0435]|uniref:hypothetical protein n=1 Tax=Paenibacillus sp. FSL L8-0435 TaxID=2954618 RepID=UPI0030D7483D